MKLWYFLLIWISRLFVFAHMFDLFIHNDRGNWILCLWKFTKIYLWKRSFESSGCQTRVLILFWWKKKLQKRDTLFAVSVGAHIFKSLIVHCTVCILPSFKYDLWHLFSQNKKLDQLDVLLYSYSLNILDST